jgi:hypothetical protein
MEYKELSTNWDSVIILDFLSKEERNNNDISGKLQKVLQDNGYNSTPYYLENKEDLFYCLNNLEKEAKNGKRYCLHIVAHGNSDGIGFKHTKEFVSWSELGNHFVNLNEACENTLVLNMTTCHGINGIKTNNPLDNNASFFGIIGYDKNLNQLKSIEANTLFYLGIIEGKKINDILTQMRSHFNDESFHCMTSQGYIALLNSEK